MCVLIVVFECVYVFARVFDEREDVVFFFRRFLRVFYFCFCCVFVCLCVCVLCC